MTTLTTHSEEETFRLGQRLAALLADGTTVALAGDLGAGKTVLARGFARGLGVTEPVTSPTFAIVQEYALAGGRRLCHLDLYRIGDEDAALAFGIEEFLFPADGLALVEWPDRIRGLLLPENGNALVDLRIEHVDPTTRRLILPTALAERLAKRGGER